MFWHLDLGRLRWHNPFSALLRRFREREANACGDPWRGDPLAHPALRAMSQRDLGDLPFDPRRVDPE